MLHIIQKFSGKDKQGHFHYLTKCSIDVTTEKKLAAPPKGEPLVVEVNQADGILCKSCDQAQYNISQPIGNFVNSASKSGFMSAKVSPDAAGKEEAFLSEGYGADGELSSDDGLGSYEQTL